MGYYEEIRQYLKPKSKEEFIMGKFLGGVVTGIGLVVTHTLCFMAGGISVIAIQEKRNTRKESSENEETV